MIKATKIITSSTDFLNGVLLLFYKPIGWSSFDVVKVIRNTIKRTRDIKKIKVGHAGTLDPLADGLLIICTGKLTKKIDEIQAQKKIYTGEITLGSTTPSYDKETEINETFPTKHITKELLYSSCKNFQGKIMQKPPIYSALKRNGIRLYEHARKGNEVDLKEREVEIYNFLITEIIMPKIKFEICCSKGTYIRSLAYDYACQLKSGGHLSKLRRESIGSYHLSNAFTIEKFQQSIV